MMMKLLKTFDLHSRNQNPKNERKKERKRICNLALSLEMLMS